MKYIQSILLFIVCNLLPLGGVRNSQMGTKMEVGNFFRDDMVVVKEVGVRLFGMGVGYHNMAITDLIHKHWSKQAMM